MISELVLEGFIQIDQIRKKNCFPYRQVSMHRGEGEVAGKSRARKGSSGHGEWMGRKMTEDESGKQIGARLCMNRFHPVFTPYDW